MKTEQLVEKRSVVAKRFDAFVGLLVEIRLTWSPSLLMRAEVLGIVPAGRDYFLEVRVDGKPHMLSTRAVLELFEAPCG